jgi:hypothetical protein
MWQYGTATTPHTRRPIEDVFIDIEDCSASSSGKKLFFFFERSPKGRKAGGEAKLRQTPSPEAVGEGATNLAHPATPSTVKMI